MFFNNLNFLQQYPSKKKEDRKKFKIHTRWGSRARLNALLTIAACRDFAERVRSMCTQLSLIWSFLFLFRFYIIFFVFCFSSFFVFLIFGGFYIVSLCLRCLYLFLYFMQIVFLLCFWFFCHFFIFSVGWGLLFFSFFWMFSFLFCFSCFPFFVCDALFSLSLNLSDKNYKSLVSVFAFCSQNSFFVKFPFLECPFSNTIFPFFVCVCNFVRWISSPCFFPSFGEKWGKGSKNTRPEICCFSLSLFFNQFSFFTFFTLWFCCFFFLPFFDVLFIPKNKKV